MDQQQRRSMLQSVPVPVVPVTATSPLLDDFYDLLQSTRTGGVPGGALKMEPEFSWGASIPQQQQAPQQLFYDDSLPTMVGADMASASQQFATGTQIQALRDFMVYGSTTPAVVGHGASSFYHGGVVGEDAPVVVGGDHGSGVGGIPSLAYRTLCNEMYGVAPTERSPHRSQFQRENHILAERQRREEMNEKFSALRAMIPKATKKDKASIVGDTIDYVLELEKRLKQLQACKENSINNNNSHHVFSSTKKRLRCDDGNNTGGASTSSETTMNTTHHHHHHLPLPAAAHAHGGDHSVVSSPSDQITAESKLQSGKGMKDGLGGVAEVDVQQLGKQAVVKVVCARRAGHVLRVLNALEECKLEVLQSNVMTVADNSIHFVTVQLEDGVSVPTEELVSAVLQAINPSEA